jgi:hypothetical protein
MGPELQHAKCENKCSPISWAAAHEVYYPFHEPPSVAAVQVHEKGSIESN